MNKISLLERKYLFRIFLFASGKWWERNNLSELKHYLLPLKYLLIRFRALLKLFSSVSCITKNCC